MAISGAHLRRKDSSMAVSLGWAPEGKRLPGRPKETWRRVVMKRLKTVGVKTWNEAADIAKDREKWKATGKLLWEPLCVTRHSAS